MTLAAAATQDKLVPTTAVVSVVPTILAAVATAEPAGATPVLPPASARLAAPMTWARLLVGCNLIGVHSARIAARQAASVT